MIFFVFVKKVISTDIFLSEGYNSNLTNNQTDQNYLNRIVKPHILDQNKEFNMFNYNESKKKFKRQIEPSHVMPDQNEDFYAEPIDKISINIDLIKKAKDFGPYIPKNYAYAALLHQYLTILYPQASMNLEIPQIVNAEGQVLEKIKFLRDFIVYKAQYTLFILEKKELIKEINQFEQEMGTYSEMQKVVSTGKYYFNKLRLKEIEDKINGLNFIILALQAKYEI